MKTTSLRRVGAALAVAVTAALAHGAWFGFAAATPSGPDQARVRLMTWDEYQRIWVGTYLAAADTIKSSETAIIELRPETSGQSVDLSSIASLVELLSATDLDGLGIPAPASTPLDNNGLPLDGTGGRKDLRAQGTPVFARLRLSQPSTMSESRPAVETWAGPLDPTPADIAAEDVGGSVGLHAVRLATVIDGGAATGDDIGFIWDIGRWAPGDVLLGITQASYKVLDRTGEFKRFIGSQDLGVTVNGEPLNEFTPGCAANWRTGEFYATNLAWEDPAVNIFSRHPGLSSDPGYIRPYVNANKRIRTGIARVPDPLSSAVDKAPESVVFDANLNLYVGHSFPYLGESPLAWDGVPAAEGTGPWGEYIYEWGIHSQPIAFNDGGSPVLVDEAGQLLMLRREGPADPDTNPLLPRDYGFTSVRLEHTPDGTALAGFITLSPTNFPELAQPVEVPRSFFADGLDGQWLVNALGARVAPVWPLGKRLHRYQNLSTDPLAAPVYATNNRQTYWTFTSRQGTDNIDISSDNVIYYTSEDAYIHRYDPVAGRQLPDLGGRKLQVRRYDGSQMVLEHGDRRYAGVRLLPPGDGSGGLLVAAGDGIFRYDQDGNFLQEYQVKDDPDSAASTGDPLVKTFYAVEIDPSGKTFWAFANFDTGWLYQFDIASGRLLKRLLTVDYEPITDSSPGRRMEGVCVMFEYTAAQEACNNGIDDDGDGLVDENCKAIEVCGNAIDEDGDGLADNNDPDCAAERPPTAADDFYSMNQPLPTVPVNDPSRQLVIDVAATNRVLGNDSDPDNNPDTEDYSPAGVDPLVVALVGPSGTPALAAGTTFTTVGGGSVTLMPSGLLTYRPADGFHGRDTLVYQITDGAANSNTATITIDVKPFVRNDSYTISERTILTVNARATGPDGLLVNDSAAPLTITAAGFDIGNLSPMSSSGETFWTPRGGQVTVWTNGNFSYDPNGFVGVETFVYRGRDDHNDSWNIATVTITVNDVNVVVAEDDGEFNTNAGWPVTVSVLNNDNDPDGDAFAITHINGTATAAGVTRTITNGTARLNANGTITVTPNAGFWGLITFTYSITDQPGVGTTPAVDTATVSVRVKQTGLNLVDDFYTTRVNQLLTVPASTGILSNDTTVGKPVQYVDVRGPKEPVLLTWVGTTGTAGGTLTVMANGSITYLPPLNFQGLDAFRYYIYDDNNVEYLATVLIRVLGNAQVIAGGGRKVYGEPDPALTPVTTAGFLAADLPGISLGQARGVGENVGTYTVTPTANGGNLNHYVVEYITGAFVIEQAPSVTTATGGTFTYDGTSKPQTCAVRGANGVTLTAGVPSYSPGGSTAPRTVGTYQVTCTYPGDNNHLPSTGTNTVTINPKEAVVTAGSGSKTYGVVAETLTSVATTGFLASDLSGGITLSQSRATGQDVGNYVTTATAGGTAAGNYTISYVAGNFRINPASLTVRANDKTKLLGQPNPVLDGTITGAVNGDVFSATYATTAVTESPVGTYPIVPTLVDAGSRASNYNVSVVNGTLTIITATCSTTGYTTYSQGGWGSPASGNNPGALLAANFSRVYPTGSVSIGGTYKMTFDSASAIERFLPAGGGSKALTRNYSNPTSSAAGNIGAQLLALQLARDFSAAGVLKSGLGTLVMQSGPFQGQTVDEILAVANAAVGGQSSVLPSGMSYSTLSGILESLNLNFHEGTVNQGLLGCPSGSGGGGRPCTATTFQFTGSSSTSGTAGNVRSFSAGGINVKAAAYSRTKSGSTWSTAFLGVWSWGMGVTDGSEGDGDGDLHKVDNGGSRNNYILFVFDAPVSITRAYLDSIGGDSDAQFWVGTVNNAYTTLPTMDDALLNSLSATESTTTSSSARWASFNGTAVSGNVLIVAAKTSETNDAFKVSKLDATCASGSGGGTTPPPTPVCSTSTMQFTGSSDSDGTDGNVRRFASGGINAKVTGFSREKSKAKWATAYVGVWSQGMGVTDSGEGSGSSDKHKLDNYDRNNYLLVVLDKNVTITKAYLDSIGGDSDAEFWVGTVANAYTSSSALQLSDSVLNGLTKSESTTTSSSARWATFNSSSVTGNVLVIAAKTGETNDAFKLSKLEMKSCQ